MPLPSASAKKPAIRIMETLFEIVMVRRSLDAANAISAGNSISLARSATMIALDGTVGSARLKRRTRC